MLSINWMADGFSRLTGLGRHSTHMVRALTRAGVRVFPLSVEMADWDTELLWNLNVAYDKITVALLSSAIPFPTVAGRLWGYTMFESTEPPKKQVESINQNCERLLVPSHWLIDVYRKAGVKSHIPIHVLPEGIDPYEFPYMKRPKREAYTFLTLGDRGGRKGDDIAWSAFFRAFEGVEDVRIIVKCTSENHALMDLSRTDSRLSLWRGDAERMADVYALADCFVFPSRGEGWGLPAREAAATGLPVIATNWGGLMDGIQFWGIPVPATLTGSPMGGQWGVPLVEDVADRMRYCYDHQEDAAANAWKASLWLHANETWDHAAATLIGLVEEYGAYREPVRNHPR